MTKLIPGEPLIYERNDGVVYARYRDPPHNAIPRWIVGGNPDSVARANGEISSSEMKEIFKLAKTNTTLKTLIDKLYTTYLLTKGEQ